METTSSQEALAAIRPGAVSKRTPICKMNGDDLPKLKRLKKPELSGQVAYYNAFTSRVLNTNLNFWYREHMSFMSSMRKEQLQLYQNMCRKQKEKRRVQRDEHLRRQEEIRKMFGRLRKRMLLRRVVAKFRENVAKKKKQREDELLSDNSAPQGHSRFTSEDIPSSSAMPIINALRRMTEPQTTSLRSGSASNTTKEASNTSQEVLTEHDKKVEKNAKEEKPATTHAKGPSSYNKQSVKHSLKSESHPEFSQLAAIPEAAHESGSHPTAKVPTQGNATDRLSRTSSVSKGLHPNFAVDGTPLSRTTSTVLIKGKQLSSDRLQRMSTSSLPANLDLDYSDGNKMGKINIRRQFSTNSLGLQYPNSSLIKKPTLPSISTRTNRNGSPTDEDRTTIQPDQYLEVSAAFDDALEEVHDQSLVDIPSKPPLVLTTGHSLYRKSQNNHQYHHHDHHQYHHHPETDNPDSSSRHHHHHHDSLDDKGIWYTESYPCSDYDDSDDEAHNRAKSPMSRVRQLQREKEYIVQRRARVLDAEPVIRYTRRPYTDVRPMYGEHKKQEFSPPSRKLRHEQEKIIRQEHGVDIERRLKIEDYFNAVFPSQDLTVKQPIKVEDETVKVKKPALSLAGVIGQMFAAQNDKSPAQNHWDRLKNCQYLRVYRPVSESKTINYQDNKLSSWDAAERKLRSGFMAFAHKK